MPSPDQLTELQNPEILKAFFSDVKTSEIQSKLDAIHAEGIGAQISTTAQRNQAMNLLRGIAEAREGATY